MRDVSERLRDIQEAISRIERYAVRGRAAFDQDELIQNWIVHHLQIIGEAVATLPSDVRDLAPDIPWRKVVGMRNILVHHYFSIDGDTVWGVIEQDLPQLRRAVDTLLLRLCEEP
jgi:uncharacterized protein with HEPN domain